VATPAPVLRLPDGARPVKSTVELTIDPSIEDFTASITTELEITAPLTTLWLDGNELVIDEASFATGGARIAAAASYSGKDYVGLTPAHPLAPGPATLTARYHGKMHRNDGDGIYTAQETGDWYAFTQFEATDARQAFPCFDEPSYKIPWQITLHVKRPLVALSNTPIVAETDEPDGMKRVQFAQTKPLPSYLLAFAVGPFEAVDAGKTRSGAPIRIVTPRGRTADAAYAAEATKPLLDRLEDYFGIPYPYPKLDMLSVPVFNAGAMENPGLITWQQGLILTKPEEMTQARRETYATVAAHEMAHQWFGDYVTLAWWDDTWLNESFASWMESKIVEAWKPEWEIAVGRVGGRGNVMRGDSLDTARTIRQPIETANDILNAFDGITYGKGEQVLTMLERTIGAGVWQRGVRAYLAEHAWHNATYDDFVTAMSTAAGKDLHPLFDSFVLQSGVPLVSFELACDKARPPALAMTQRRYAPIGSKIDPKRTWHIPVCVRWGAGGQTGHDCGALDGETGELALSAPSCPAWVMPNEEGVGYYRMLPRGDLLPHLIAQSAKALSLPERIALMSDVSALVTSGDLPYGSALRLASTLATDKNRSAVAASIAVVAGIDELVPAALRASYERFVRKTYQARAHELTWRPKKGEDENTREQRGTVVPLVANLGRDPELVKQATELAWKWLDAHSAVDPDLVRPVLGVAARNGDQKLFDRLHAAAKATQDRVERGQLLGAMARFTDPKIVAQALAIGMTDEFETRQAVNLVYGPLGDPRTREQAYTFLHDHFDELVNKLPPSFRVSTARVFAPLCDDSRKADIQAFFGPRIEKFDGGPRVMAQTLESLSLCSEQRKAQRPGVEAFLERP
jgi:alanyl aminopeptidase